MGERGSALKEGSGRGKKEGGWGNKKRISSSLGFFVVVLFCFFCIHLRVAIGEPLHTRMVKIWHTHTHTQIRWWRGHSQCTQRVPASLLQTEEWILFQA